MKQSELILGVARAVKRRFVRMVLSALAVAVLSGSLFADSLNVFDFTEQSSTQATITFLYRGTSYPFTRQGTSETFLTGELPIAYNCSPSPSGNYCGSDYDHVLWIEPQNPLLYNALYFSPNGNRGTLALAVFSDLTSSDVSSLFSTCNSPSGNVPCPVLGDGQSFDVPLSNYECGPTHQFCIVGSMTVSFHDQGDIAGTAPEPQGILLLTTGLFLLGARLRRQRAPGRKRTGQYT